MAAKDITTLMEAFPRSFDIVSNMHCQYTIRTDPSVKPMQNACHKVPIELGEKIEKK